MNNAVSYISMASALTNKKKYNKLFALNTFESFSLTSWTSSAYYAIGLNSALRGEATALLSQVFTNKWKSLDSRISAEPRDILQALHGNSLDVSPP